MTHRSAGRLLAVLAVIGLTGALLIASAGPASAHGRTTSATNYHSRIIDAPASDAIDWWIAGGDDLVVAEVHGDVELVVLGYDGEPYLRLTADSAWENARSPATVLNEDRHARVALPDGIDADAEPQWRERGAARAAYAWHDHRAHFMGGPGQRHPEVVDAAARTHLDDWAIPVRIDGEAAEVRGELWWEPGPAWWPYVLAGLALTAPAWWAVVRLRRGEVVAAVRPAALVVAVVALANAPLLADELIAVPVPIGEAITAAGLGAVFVGLALAGAAVAWRGGRAAFVALAVAGGALLLGQGVGSWPSLTASQVPTVWSEELVRVVVGANLAVGLPVAIAALLGDRRMARLADPRPGTDAAMPP